MDCRLKFWIVGAVVMSTLSFLLTLVILVEQAETNRQLDELIYNIETDPLPDYNFSRRD